MLKVTSVKIALAPPANQKGSWDERLWDYGRTWKNVAKGYQNLALGPGSAMKQLYNKNKKGGCVICHKELSSGFIIDQDGTGGKGANQYFCIPDATSSRVITLTTCANPTCGRDFTSGGITDSANLSKIGRNVPLCINCARTFGIRIP